MGWQETEGQGTWTIMEALSWGRHTLSSAGVEGYDLDCQLLLSQAMGRERSELLAFTRRPLTPREVSSYRKAVKMRARRMPAAYILGKKEFWSADFAVDGRVLIPRPETEVLVETAAELLRPGSRILDVGTGSGCIIVSLAKEVEGKGWVALDVCRDALRVAERNIRAHGLEDRIEVVVSDLFEALRGRGRLFHGILSNPPYVPSGALEELQSEVRDYEPKKALDGGPDGLRVIRRIVDAAPSYLHEDGILFLEIGDGQAAEVMDLLAVHEAFAQIECRRDLTGRKRVVAARRRKACKASA